jgi:hypothetical protein
MIVTKKWIAAGSTATLLAGGLFLGAPMASAAPGDADCLKASVQFNAALGAAGVDVGFVNQLEAATAAVVAAADNAVAVALSLNLDVLIEEAETTNLLAEDAQLAVEVAQLAVDAAPGAVVDAQAAVDVALAASVPTEYPDPETDPAVVSARAALVAAEAAVVTAGTQLDAARVQETAAVEAALTAGAAADAALSDPALALAEEQLIAAGEAADSLLAQLSGNEALAAEILALFKGFLAACDASAIGVDPVTPVVVPAVPVAPAPVAPGTGTGTNVTAPTGTTVTAPTGTNKGLNVQTAVVTEDNSPAIALLAALLAVGVAVPVATAARMRRLERAQR